MSISGQNREACLFCYTPIQHRLAVSMALCDISVGNLVDVRTCLTRTNCDAFLSALSSSLILSVVLFAFMRVVSHFG